MTAWIIQRDRPIVGMVYAGTSGFGGPRWHSDPTQAARFPSKAAAEYVIRAYRATDWLVRRLDEEEGA